MALLIFPSGMNCFLFIQFTGKLSVQNDTEIYSLPHLLKYDTSLHIFPFQLLESSVLKKRSSLSVRAVEVHYRHQRAREPKSHQFLCEGLCQ